MNMSDKTINGVPVHDILYPIAADDSFVERIAFRKVKAPQIAIVESDPEWPNYFQTFKKRILDALDTKGLPQEGVKEPVTILSVEHVGSTSVPGLPAKAVIDIDLVLCPNTVASEAFYVPRLEAAGFQFLLREPEWYQHRFFAAHEPMSCNLHVFGPQCAAVERHRVFQDWLREHDDDRELYAETKRECAAMATANGESITDYSDRKDGVIREIVARAVAGAGH